MPDNPDIVLKIRVLDAQGNFLGGAVDVEFKHRTLSDRVVRRSMDASREIAVSGLRRAPTGDYQVTVTPTTVFKPQSQFVNLPASGFATLDFVFRKEGAATTSATKPEPPRPEPPKPEPPKPEPPKPEPVADAVTYAVEGTVSSADRGAVGGLRVLVVDKNAGPDVTLAETVTDGRGRYRVTFTSSSLRARGKDRPDLQARVHAGREFLAASDVLYDAGEAETLHVLLPANSSALPSEYETLTRVLAPHHGGPLGDLKESGDRRDITYLANKTGWDARAVALAALADQFSRDGADGQAGAKIHPAFYYALFRAGLPADRLALYRADAGTVRQVWARAIEEGVIPRALEREADAAAAAFQKLGAAQALDARALAGAATLREMLSLSLGDDARRQQQFAELHARHGGELPKFWDEVRRSFGEETAQRLRLDGQLGFLTFNNAPLIGRLRHAERGRPLASTHDLARRGYYRPEKWAALLEGDAVPEQIPGATPEERRGRYAALLAAQVRLSFPTAVIAEQVRSGEIPLDADASVRDGVHAFLTEHQGGFELGAEPVERYLARQGTGGRVAAPVREQLKKIQRVYQITPSDRAMKVLLGHKLDSAYGVVRYDEAEFVRRFGAEMGGDETARRTHQKSQQVHNAVLNLVTSYVAARRAPALGAHPGARALDPGRKLAEQGQAENAADVIAYPTLEELFGAMDFCACEHCRSILSPAAYLVDLLLFLDRPVNEKENPQKVLLDRRPDIQFLPLTCENTNTPLPYIDVVNETLEHFVTHDLSLGGYKGHDTGAGATAEELLAGPRFVSEAAYDKLKAELFPPPLPFHKSLETLRRYFGQFDFPLHAAMEALRETEALERASAAAYGWRDILMERLKLSRAEYKLLSGGGASPRQLYGYPPGASDAEVLADLSSVKAFARRVGVTYEELVAILKTRFVNPGLALLARLERLGLPFETLKQFKDGGLTGQQFDDLLPEDLDPAKYGGDVKAWVKDAANYAAFMRLITIANPNADGDPCDFDQLEFRYADPDESANRLRPFEFVRLARFIRLWKKLGWSIDQTDEAIAALYPAEHAPSADADAGLNLKRLDDGFLVLLPRLGVVVGVMERLGLTPQKDLQPLLACWAAIGTAGASALYRKMFLGPTLAEPDGAFADDGYGDFLQDEAETVVAHAETLRAAFGLTGDEFSRLVDAVVADLNGAQSPDPPLTPDTLRLTLDNISAIHRRGWLARKLRLSVREFLLLTEFARLDPFAAPDIEAGAEDAGPPQVERLLRLVEALKAAGLKLVQALYLIWNQDLSGQSAPEEALLTGLARALRADFAGIEGAFAVANDPNGDLARARMALVYGAEATDFFFGLLDGTLTVDVPYAHPQPALGSSILDLAPGRIFYDEFGKRLSYRGVLEAATRDALKSAAGASAEFEDAVDELYEANQSAVGPFFVRYPELEPLYSAYAASSAPPEQKRTELLANFLPELKRRHKRQQALAVTAATAGTDVTLTQAVLNDAQVLHAAGDQTQPALDDLTALETPGLSVEFFWGDVAAGQPDAEEAAAPSLDYSADGANSLPANPTPGGNVSGVWAGYLEVPESGFYNLAVEADPGASVTLTLDGQPVALLAGGGELINQDALSLAAGALYPVVLKVEKVKERLAVRWQTTGRGWELIPPRHLYSATLVGRLRDAYVRFLKAASLAAALRLTAGELAHLAAHEDYQEIGGEGWLNALPVTGDPDAATARALREVLTALLDFARLKAEFSPDDERLLALLREPGAALPNGSSLLLTLTGWNGASLDELLKRFLGAGAGADPLRHVETFRRVRDAYAVVTATGVPASALVEATTNEPTAAAVGNFQSALRARYGEADWLNVLKPLNDELRGLRRDALVAYVLRRMQEDPDTAHIDTPDKLFEYFLMDVQMEPCMQTSRIRHALSSVQLFVERCLMNLEPRVAPSSIKAGQWAWMKRYRVWEANRKVFLWPENWLEPELRDDQSPFFREVMSELLQSDITEDSAAAALLNYLSKLEEVARLEPCGIHYVENDPGTADDVAHVVARTTGASRKYFYRRRDGGSWTPWEQIKLDIEDDPVIPVVWKNRLFLFWLRILKQTPNDPDQDISSGAPGNVANANLDDLRKEVVKGGKKVARVQVQAVLCWSEYYNGKWQPAKTSDVNHPLEMSVHPPAGPYAFNRSHLLLRVNEETVELHEPEVPAQPGGAPPAAGVKVLRVNVRNIFEAGFGAFVFFNTHSLPEVGFTEFMIPEGLRVLDTSADELTVKYYNNPPEHYWILDDWALPTRRVLKTKTGDRTVEPEHDLANRWDAPFFYKDRRHVFYVTTTERLVRLQDYHAFGVRTAARQPAPKFPPLSHETAPLARGPNGDPVTAAGAGLTNPDPDARVVAGDGNIHTRIAAGTRVRFGDKVFGPSGALDGGDERKR